MISATATGFKVTLAPKAVEGVQEMGEFFSDLKHEGLWYAIFGQHFTESLHDLWEGILHFSDGAVIVALVFCILIIFGSKRARTALYWTMAIYLLLQILGAIL